MPVDEVKLRMTVKNVVEDILKNGDVMFNMMDIRNYDEYIYYHSVNVGVLSIMVGARYGLERSKLYDLGVAAMLHDIGKKFYRKKLPTENGRLKGLNGKRGRVIRNLVLNI